jgi:hypothetical protein
MTTANLTLDKETLNYHETIQFLLIFKPIHFAKKPNLHTPMSIEQISNPYYDLSVHYYYVKV